MPSTNLASIYAVSADGSTAELLGTGILLTEELVVVHPPLDGQLARSAGRPGLRIGLGGAGLIEILDVVATHTSEEGPVALELGARSASTPCELPGAEHEDLALRVARLVEATVPPGLPTTVEATAREEGESHDDAPRGPRPRPRPRPGGPHLPGGGWGPGDRPPWCGVWPTGPGCRP